MERKNCWEDITTRAKEKEVDRFAKSYIEFLNNGKTERECVDQIVNRIEAEGYTELSKLGKKKLKAG
ncbi:MAG: aminopeptidase, partial [Lachnospiraceae bacterium]|nr:aminopeptidase [Lachnospiraceae bacterium]